MGREPSVTSSPSYLLVKAGLIVGRAMDDALTAFELSSRQFLLLSTITEHEMESQLEIARHMLLDPTVVVALLDDLERRGFVSRSRHPDDRRRHVVSLTPNGAKVRKKAMAALAAAERSFLAELSAAERSSFEEQLRRVVTPKLGRLAPGG